MQSVKRISSIINGSTPKSGEPLFWEGTIPWVTPADLGKRKSPYIEQGQRSITLLGLESCGTTLVPTGAIILSSRAPIGTLGIASQDMCTNQGCKSLIVSGQHVPKFLFYVLACNTKQLNVLGRGTTFLELSTDELGNYKICIPSKEEQNQIVQFLDHETAKIDTLIEKQQRLIALLKEKRQAVISHAVTKGLNPDVPMKDSGVEWLGQVPEHWEIKTLRHLGSCQNGINIGAEYFGSGYPFVSYGDVYNNEALPARGSGLVQSSDSDRRSYSIIRGDVLFTRTSETIEEIGFSSVCFENISDAVFAGFLIRFRPASNKLECRYSKYYFRNSLLRLFFVREMNLVTRASLSQDLLKRLPVPVPSITEQKEIADFLDKTTAVFSKLEKNAQEAILLMQERRTALISAAVTGKIDVRGWEAKGT